MSFKHRYFALALCSLFLVVGCDKEPEVVEPSGPDAPALPTAQEIAQKIVAEANLDMPVPASGGRFPASVRNSMLSILQAAKAKNSADPVGKEALEHVVGRIDRRIRDFKKANAWQHVMVFTDAHAIFQPNSKKYGSLRDEAFIQLKKPVVQVTGLPTIEGRQLVFLSIYVPMTDKSYKEQVLVGDELHGIKVVSIFGQDRGVMLEYLVTGERYVAYLPGAK